MQNCSNLRFFCQVVATVFSDHGEFWHGTAYHVFTLTCQFWPWSGKECVQEPSKLKIWFKISEFLVVFRLAWATVHVKWEWNLTWYNKPWWSTLLCEMWPWSGKGDWNCIKIAVFHHKWTTVYVYTDQAEIWHVGLSVFHGFTLAHHYLGEDMVILLVLQWLGDALGF